MRVVLQKEKERKQDELDKEGGIGDSKDHHEQQDKEENEEKANEEDEEKDEEKDEEEDRDEDGEVEQDQQTSQITIIYEYVGLFTISSHQYIPLPGAPYLHFVFHLLPYQ